MTDDTERVQQEAERVEWDIERAHDRLRETDDDEEGGDYCQEIED